MGYTVTDHVDDVIEASMFNEDLDNLEHLLGTLEHAARRVEALYAMAQQGYFVSDHDELSCFDDWVQAGKPDMDEWRAYLHDQEAARDEIDVSSGWDAYDAWKPMPFREWRGD